METICMAFVAVYRGFIGVENLKTDFDGNLKYPRNIRKLSN
jgi:hypothetical protein